MNAETRQPVRWEDILNLVEIGEVTPFKIVGVKAGDQKERSLYLLFIHPGAPNLISLRSAGTMPA